MQWESEMDSIKVGVLFSLYFVGFFFSLHFINLSAWQFEKVA